MSVIAAINFIAMLWNTLLFSTRIILVDQVHGPERDQFPS